MPAGEPAALADAIDRLLGDADLRRRLGAAGERALRARVSGSQVAEVCARLYAARCPARALDSARGAAAAIADEDLRPLLRPVDNAAGRAVLLARLLAPLGEVEVLGPVRRPRLGAVAAEGVRYVARCRAAAGRASPRRWPRSLRQADGDLLYASKPRLGERRASGYLARARTRRPLVLDIDDWEVGFFLRGGFWGTVGRARQPRQSRGLPWTWLMERLGAHRRRASPWPRASSSSASAALLVPHVRDTDAWKPGAADPAPARGSASASRTSAW